MRRTIPRSRAKMLARAHTISTRPVQGVSHESIQQPPVPTSSNNSSNTVTGATNSLPAKSIDLKSAIEPVSSDVDEIKLEIITLDEATKERPRKHQHLIAVCCCGFAPQSLKYTISSIQANVIDHLGDEFDMDVYMYSLLSKNNVIESGKNNNYQINNDDVKLLKTEATWTAFQEDVAAEIKSKLIANKTKLRDVSIVNFMRGLYMESKCYENLVKHAIAINVQYDAIIFIQPNMFISKPIAIREIYNVIRNPESVYTSSFNDWDGYGAGFYIGGVKSLACICNRINNLSHGISKIESEKFLKETINASEQKIKRYKSDIFYFKIHANGKPDVYYQLLKKYTSSCEHMNSIRLYKLALSQHPPRIENLISKSKDDRYLPSSIQPSDNSFKRRHKRRSCPN